MDNSEYTHPKVSLNNLFYIAGKHVFIRSHNSVSNHKIAKSASWLLDALYSICLVFQMFLPLIFRILNLQLRKVALAKSNSINSTLYNSTSVITNDILMRSEPDNSSLKLIRIGYFSTAILGIITIIIVLIVPMFGGIVELILSMAILIGGAIFLPPLWSLFSPYQTGFSVLIITITSLTINVFLNLFAPTLFDLILSRTLEMVIGVGFPVLLLILTEIYFILSQMKNKPSDKYKLMVRSDIFSEIYSTDSNKKIGRVLATGIASAGVLTQFLSLFADNSSLLLAALGIMLLVLGCIILWISI